MRSADFRIADHLLEQPLADGQRFHAVARYDKQKIVWTQRGDCPANRLVNHGVVSLQQPTVAPAIIVADVAKPGRHGVAKEVVANLIRTLKAHQRNLHWMYRGQSLVQSFIKLIDSSWRLVPFLHAV